MVLSEFFGVVVELTTLPRPGRKTRFFRMRRTFSKLGPVLALGLWLTGGSVPTASATELERGPDSGLERGAQRGSDRGSSAPQENVDAPKSGEDEAAADGRATESGDGQVVEVSSGKGVQDPRSGDGRATESGDGQVVEVSPGKGAKPQSGDGQADVPGEQAKDPAGDASRRGPNPHASDPVGEGQTSAPQAKNIPGDETPRSGGSTSKAAEVGDGTTPSESNPKPGKSTPSEQPHAGESTPKAEVDGDGSTPSESNPGKSTSSEQPHAGESKPKAEVDGDGTPSEQPHVGESTPAADESSPLSDGQANEAKANPKKRSAKTAKSKKSKRRRSRKKSSASKRAGSKSKRSQANNKRSSSKRGASAKSLKRKQSGSRKRKKQAKSKRKPGHPDCEFRTPIYEHKVEAGEHLGAIAGRYGVRRADLVRLNPKLQKNPDLIHPGQSLRVCPDIAPRRRVEKTHVVVKGESLGRIASAYGLTVRELVGLQQGKLRKQLERNPNSLWIDSKLKVLVEEEELEVYKPPDEDTGKLPVGVKLRERKGVLIKRSHLVWGTKATIKAVEKAVRLYQKRMPGGPKVRIGDISKKGGGPLRGHLSHQRGVDVDVGIIHKGSKRNAERFTHATTENLDVARTWALLKAFIDTQQVRVIFLDYALQKRLYKYAKSKGVSEDTLDELFQYPRGRGRTSGIVRHWRSHRGHLHVRFRR